MNNNILVIKLSALGDFFLALGAFEAIRSHHEDDHITLLTTRAYENLGRKTGFFDCILIDKRPKIYHVAGLFSLRKTLNDGHFKRVYDLQTSSRSSWYYHLFPLFRKPEWSGISRGCSHVHNTPLRRQMHPVDRLEEQLKIAGINQIPKPNLRWASFEPFSFSLPEKFALLVPGAAPHRHKKRWPPYLYGAFAACLLERKITPVLIGTQQERLIVDEIRDTAPGCLDLTDKTCFLSIAALGRQALFAVGNDTGPMHIITLSGCPSVVLFSASSTPATSAQQGPCVTLIQRQNIADITPEMILRALEHLETEKEICQTP